VSLPSRLREGLGVGEPGPRLLGAVLAGGASRRFGSDKALAMLRGKPLIENVIAALATECETVIVCGRDWPSRRSLADRPGPGLGPLGGLAAAFHHAAASGHDAVLAAACDLAELPPGLAARLAPGPAVAAGQPALGLWPAALAARLDTHLASGGRSLFGWAAAAGARSVIVSGIANINTPADLAALTAGAAPAATGRGTPPDAGH